MSGAPTVEFFSVTAQVIPVMFLALVLEKRFRTDQNEQLRIGFAWTIVLLIAAEVVSLGTVAVGQPPPWVGTALVLFALAYASLTFLVNSMPIQQAESTRERVWYVMILVLGFLVIFGGVAWLWFKVP